MIIDAHGHLFHARWYPEAFRRCLVEDAFGGRAGDAGRSARQGETLVRMLADDDGRHTLAAMDAAGIERRVVLILDWGLELGEAECSIRTIHEEILTVCARHRDRLTGFAGVDPRRPDAPAILAWAIDELGARGLKLHPTSEGWRLNDPSTRRLIDVMAERQLPIVVHVGPTLRILSATNASFEALLELAADYPAVPFIAGHAGGGTWRGLLTCKDVPANLYADVSAWQARLADPESLAQDLEALARLLPGRVLFGTDSPFYAYGAVSERRWVDGLRHLVAERNLALEAFFANSVLRRLTEPQ